MTTLCYENETFTVEELIEVLSKMPPDAGVMSSGWLKSEPILGAEYDKEAHAVYLLYSSDENKF